MADDYENRRSEKEREREKIKKKVKKKCAFETSSQSTFKKKISLIRVRNVRIFFFVTQKLNVCVTSLNLIILFSFDEKYSIFHLFPFPSPSFFPSPPKTNN